MSGRRISWTDLANPTVIEFDTVGRDWHIRLGADPAGPCTFVRPDEARSIAAAWAALADDLEQRGPQ